MAHGSTVPEDVQDIELPDSGQHTCAPASPGQRRPRINTVPVTTLGYGTCRNAYRCGCTGYVGWGNGYACSRCGCGFGDHY
jgi:hypothetical protein